MKYESPSIKVLEFVDLRDTHARLAGAIAFEEISRDWKKHIENIEIVSSGVQVQRIKEARNNLPKLDEIAKEYESLANQRGVNYNPDEIKEFFRYLGGGKEIHMLKQISKVGGLRYLDLYEAPKQTTKDPTRNINKELKAGLGAVFALGGEAYREACNIYKKKTSVPEIYLLRAKDIAFANEGDYKSIIEDLRGEVSEKVNNYFSLFPKD